MTTSDKTRQKLVDSMRKTKAASGSESGDSSKPAASVGPRAKSRKTGTKGKTKTSPTPSRQGSADPYQAGRRVWPD